VEISLYFKKKNQKFRVHLNLLIYHWDFLFHEKVNSKKIPQELLV
jgi:hypothetical protein